MAEFMDRRGTVPGKGRNILKPFRSTDTGDSSQARERNLEGGQIDGGGSRHLAGSVGTHDGEVREHGRWPDQLRLVIFSMIPKPKADT